MLMRNGTGTYMSVHTLYAEASHHAASEPTVEPYSRAFDEPTADRTLHFPAQYYSVVTRL